ncbi:MULTISPECIES: hypothetical protein [Methanobacterium]|uniref:Uncharacterized protein n=1 Tax=Methanobacterium veterum TaxID=408577 RepID=A0A9E5A536_9EURY|nr:MULTISPECIES: hypothetical protein [Methanobacterium]MCZ3364991.1 hypothetical protein [Methanobacterium veterum]MCZ3372746.1 hypothetical protein [Methanobacterium veterum]
MLDRDTYEKWTDVFIPGSHYVGGWSKGSKILFLVYDEICKMSGIVSRIKENRLYDYISIAHRCEMEVEQKWNGWNP